MDVKINAIKKRKLMAVVGDAGAGVFLRGAKDTETYYLSSTGIITSVGVDLDRLLTSDHDRTGIYEGDSVTLTF